MLVQTLLLALMFAHAAWAQAPEPVAPPHITVVQPHNWACNAIEGMPYVTWGEMPQDGTYVLELMGGTGSGAALWVRVTQGSVVDAAPERDGMGYTKGDELKGTFPSGLGGVIVTVLAVKNLGLDEWGGRIMTHGSHQLLAMPHECLKP